MRLGIMQPYFLPHLGYFDLINSTDKWIVFDVVQYIRKGWMNRNRILDPNKEWQYITVPIKKAPRNTLIKAIEISYSSLWREKILKQLRTIYSQAMFFDEGYGLIQKCLMDNDWQYLSELNTWCLREVCEYLDIPFNFEIYSTMEIGPSSVEHPGDWALEISRAVGAQEYINPPGGRDLFDAEKFKQAGIKLSIHDMPPMCYACEGFSWVPRLSIIDVIMWNSPLVIKEYLDTWQ